MSWQEFSYLINGLSGDTPLGRIISIRAENKPETLKEFTPEQKKIRNAYRKKIALQKTEKECNDAHDVMLSAFKKIAQ